MSYLDARAIMQPGGAFAGIGDVVSQALDRYGRNQQQMQRNDLDLLRLRAQMAQAVAGGGGRGATSGGGGGTGGMDPTKAERESAAHIQNQLGIDLDSLVPDEYGNVKLPQGVPQEVLPALQQRGQTIAQRMESGQPWAMDEQFPGSREILAALEGYQPTREEPAWKLFDYTTWGSTKTVPGTSLSDIEQALIEQLGPEGAAAAMAANQDILAALDLYQGPQDAMGGGVDGRMPEGAPAQAGPQIYEGPVLGTGDAMTPQIKMWAEGAAMEGKISGGDVAAMRKAAVEDPPLFARMVERLQTVAGPMGNVGQTAPITSRVPAPDDSVKLALDGYLKTLQPR